MKQKSLGAFNIFVQWKNFGHLTFCGTQYMNLVKSRCSTEKLCTIMCHQQPKFWGVSTGPRVKIQNCDVHCWWSRKVWGHSTFLSNRKIWSLDILWYPIHESSEKQMFDWKAMYNRVISSLNSEELVLGLEWKSKIVMFIVDEAEKFGGIQHFCPMEKFWSLDILWYPIHESSEKQMFNWKAMYNHVISNLNSEELVLGLEWKSKIVIFIVDEAEKFGGIQHFCLIEKIWSLDILWYPIHESSKILTFNWKTLYNCVIGNLNSEQLVLGQEWKSKIVIVISDEAGKFGGIQHFYLMEKIWSLDISWYPIHESSEKQMFDWKAMYNRVISNLNSESQYLA